MTNFIEQSNSIIILIILGISLFVLSKAADHLVDNAVILSKIWGLPEMIIGATVISLGTTLPELSASVTSTLQGNGGFALGNAVGSIITNTSLIIGIGALFGKIPVDKKSSSKLTLLIIAVLLLIFPSFPYKIAHGVGHLPQGMGLLFLILVPFYIYFLIYQEKKSNKVVDNKINEIIEKDKEQKIVTETKEKNQVKLKGDMDNPNNKKPKDTFIIGKILIAALVIAISSTALVGSSETLAVRIGIPDVIIASTLVAFGTSVPELSTCITAVKKKHGGLALGNIMGANILNILLVVGTSISLTSGGLAVAKDFYNIHFIALGAVISVFAFFAYNHKIDEISRREGIILIIIYTIYLGANIWG